MKIESHEWVMTAWAWHKSHIRLIFIMMLTVLVYSNSMNNSFQYDDYHSIINNASIRTLRSIPIFFTTGSLASESPEGNNHRPLLYVTYTLNYALGGYTPWGYHLVNLAFHLLSVCFLFMIVRRLSERSDIAVLASLIFALHPMNTEAVNYITARSTVMSSCFMLLSLLGFMTYRSTSTHFPPEADIDRWRRWKVDQSWAYYLGSLLALALALLTKETTVILPALFLLYDLCFFFPTSRRSIPQGLLAYLPILIVFGLGLWIRGQVLGRSLISLPPERVHIAFLTTVKIYAEYLSLLIWPFPLSIDHNLMPVRSISDPGAIRSVILISGLVLAGVISFRSFRMLSFCIFWFLVVLSPLAVLPVFTHVALLQENRGYMAAMAFSIALAWGFRGRERLAAPGPKQNLLPRMKWVFIGLVLVVYAAMDLHRNTIWADGPTLWLDTIKKYPDSLTAHYNLGLAYQKTGRWKDSVEEIERVLKADPSHPWAQYNLGVAYMMTGQWDHAEEAFRQAIKLKPQDQRAYYNLGWVYQQQRRFEQALEAYQGVLKIEPKDARAYNNMAMIYQQQGDLNAAVRAYRAALSLDPGYTKARHNLALAYKASGDIHASLQELRAVSRSNPDSALVHYHLGQAYEDLAQWDLAIAEYQTVLKLKPTWDDARQRLANLLQTERHGQKDTEQP